MPAGAYPRGGGGGYDHRGVMPAQAGIQPAAALLYTHLSADIFVSCLENLYKTVEQFQARDPYTLEIQLAQPFGPFLNV